MLNLTHSMPRYLVVALVATCLGCGAPPPRDAATPADAQGSDAPDMLNEDLDEHSEGGTDTQLDEQLHLNEKPLRKHDDAGDAEGMTSGAMKHTRQSKTKDDAEEDEPKPKTVKKP